jgi:para-nitrobenzyl esterase
MQPSGGAGGRGGATSTATPMGEDCLYLNVWTEAASASERRPVIVWSHGGALTIGSGSQLDGEALARKGAVVVAYDYRLGPFGFFSHPELTKESERNASGNYGLMDLVAVLRWVQRNIAAFGGDPNRVTLMGQSGGGRLMRAVVASSQGKGLVHRAISQSAPVRIDRMWTRAESEAAGQAEAAKVGAATLAALRAKPADEIQRGMQTGRLVVDGWYVTEDISINVAEGRHNRVDLLVGSNKDETYFVSLYPASPFFGSRKRPRSVHRRRVAVSAQMPRRFWIYTRQGRQMTPRGRRCVRPSATRPRGTRASGLWHRREPAEARLIFTTSCTSPPWRPASRIEARNTALRSLRLQQPCGVVGGRRCVLADVMSSYWVNFATRGDPNGAGLPHWPAFQPTARERLILGPEIEVGPGLDAVRVALFDRIAIRRSAAQSTR